MAILLYCPNCQDNSDFTKKGFNKDNEQLYICKTCGKKIKESEKIMATAKKPVAKKKAVAKKSVAKKTVRKVAPKVKGETDIYVNNNVIKTVPGKLSVEDAFKIVSTYFKEIAKDKTETSEVGDKKTIKFKITVGGKG